MYSAAMSSPREGVLRPSSRSEERKERWPRIESALMRSSAARQAPGTAALCADASRAAAFCATAVTHAVRVVAAHDTQHRRKSASATLVFVLIRSRLPSLDLHAAPEGDAVFNLPRRVLRLRVVPRRVPVHIAAHDHIAITRRPLPGADRVRLALAKVLALD